MIPGIQGMHGLTGATSTGGETPLSVNSLTIASGKVGSDLSNYPVYVNLADMPAGFWAAVSADGGNIRVRQSGADLAFDVVKIDTGASSGTLFFKAPSVLAASSNVFTIVTLSGLTMPSVGAGNGRNAVWSNYDWVCMMDTTGWVDRTGGSAGSLATGTATTSNISLAAGCGLNLSSVRTDFTGRPSRTIVTLGATFRPSSNPIGVNYSFLNYRNAASGATDNRITLTERSGTQEFSVWDDLNGFMGSSTSGVTDTPSRIHAVYNGTTNRKIYSGGVLKTTSGAISQHTSLDTYSVGAEDTSNAEFAQGRVGYAYARPEALSADFIAAEYSNLNAPASFYAIT